MRHIMRQFHRQPAFWTSVVLTLVLGTSTTTAVFAVVNGILLRPLAYPDGDRLVAGTGFGYKGEYLQLRERSLTVAAGAFTPPAGVSLTGAGEPLRLTATRADSAYFDVLGIKAAIGRRFTDADVSGGAPPTAILGDGVWHSRFGGRRDVVGRAIAIDGTPHVVIGVMPAAIQVPQDAELWLPLVIEPGDRTGLWSTSVRVVGRVRDGRAIADAQRELRSLLPSFRALFPWRMPADYGQRARFVPLRDEIVGDITPMLLTIFGATIAVLLILCVNVANLLLSRGLARERELAIRAALGASRTRLIRQLLLESLVASTLACALGLGAALMFIRVATPLFPSGIPRVNEIVIDYRVVAFAAGLSLTAGLLFGALPALRGSASAHHFAALRAAGTTLPPSERRIGQWLAIGEFAMAAMLVLTSALLASHLWSLLAVRPGFNRDRLVTASIAPPHSRVARPETRRQFVDDLVQRLRQAAGVRAVAAGNVVPFAGQTYSTVFSIEGRPDPARQTGEWPGADVRASVTPDYFSTLGIPLLEGRGFSTADHADAGAVAIVSRTLARRYWGGNPIDARIRFPGAAGRWITIVGIVDDVKWHSLGDEESQFPAGRVQYLSTLYLPLAQSDVDVLQVAIRTEDDRGRLAGELRALVQTVDRDTPVSRIATADALIAASTDRPRFTAGLISTFALSSLLLATIGIHGVLGYAVKRRTQEFAIRAAVGATAAEILGSVLREGLRLTLIGVVFGVAGAAVASRGVASLIPGAGGLVEPAVVGVGLLVLVASGLVASYLPARRATHVSPALALRSD